jgi:threonine dehydratase
LDIIQSRRRFLGYAGTSLGLLFLSSLSPDLLARTLACGSSAAKPYSFLFQQPPSGIVTFDNVLDAQRRISGQIVRTPFLYSRLLSKVTGTEVYVKMENLQATGAFKERGALNRLLLLTPEEKARGVITMSTGNHAQGVSLHAARLGIKATIYMPENTPLTKIERTRSLGAMVVIKGKNFDETADYARQNADADNLTLIHPYNDPAVIAGQGTTALEMLAEQPSLDAMIVPVGGGGLITGCAIAARSIKPAMKIYGVESVRYAAMSQRLKGEPVKVGGETVAEAIAVRQVGSVPVAMLPGRIEDILLVEESAIEWAIAALVTSEKEVAEGAGAAPLAALVSYPDLFAGKKVGILLSGGNIDNSHLSDILRRYRGTTEDKPPIKAGVGA